MRQLYDPPYAFEGRAESWDDVKVQPDRYAGPLTTISSHIHFGAG